MRVSVNWLKELVATEKTPWELADLFVNHGLGVESVLRIGERLENTSVAEVTELGLNKIIISLAKDNFSIVDSGYGLKIGDKVIFDSQTKQLLTKNDLGLDGPQPVVLPKEAVKGERTLLYLDDYVLDFEIAPNRGDLMGVIGIARELACYEEKELRLPKIKPTQDDLPMEENFRLEVVDKSDCPDYIARIIKDVKVAQSPFWLQWRIYASGLRPVNNVVDVANYILFKYGQPLHTFDYDKLVGKKIIVRRATAKEKIKTIDNVERSLTESVLVIADAIRTVAIAGIMGGIDTEISLATKNVLLECARFDPVVIRKGSQFLRLVTEASKRFEMVIDPANLELASWEASVLIANLAQGKISPGKSEFRTPVILNTTKIYPTRANELLGIKLKKQKIKRILINLGFKLEEKNTYWQVQIPSFRSDVQRDADLIEEIARIYGYHNIPSQFRLKGVEPGRKNPISQRLNRVKAVLTSQGFNEVYTVSFTDEATAQLFYSGNVVKIPNPLNERFSILRPRLLATILEVVNLNLRKGNKDLRLFEIGKIFTANQGWQETINLAGVITGNKEPINWLAKPKPVDYFDLKSVLEALFEEFRLQNIQFIHQPQNFLRPTDATIIKIDETEIGFIGTLSKSVNDRYELNQEVYVFEINLERIWQFSPQSKYFRPLPRYPGVLRDFAFVVDKTISAATVEKKIRQLGGELLAKVEIFDCFSGGQLAPGQKNLGVRLLLQAYDRTLSDTEANRIFDQIRFGLKQNLKIRLRGEENEQ